MTYSRPSRALLAVVAVGALALTACSSGGGTSSPKPQPTPAGINAVARADLKPGGTVKWAVTEVPTNLNFQQVDGTTQATQDIMFAVMPVLMTSTTAGDVQPDPNYLTGAQAATTSGKQVVSYDINPKATWSDGTPLTYRDFAANWKAQNGKDSAYLSASTTGYEVISSVARGKDDQEAIVTFDSPFGDWKSLFSPLYPASVITTPDGFNNGYLGKAPVSAGPFKLQGIDQSAKTVTVVRDPHWWGPSAILDGITYRALDTAATPGAFANGEIDFYSVGADAAAYRQAQGVVGAQTLKAAAPNWRQITLNGQSPILSDVNVRMALFHAVDRKTIATSDLQGLDWPPTLLGNHFLVNSQKGYHDNSGGIGTYAPDKARQELDAAGWKAASAGATRTKDGKPLELGLVIPSGLPVATNEGTLLQPMLAAVGIKLTIKPVPADQFRTQYIATGDFDMTAFQWQGTPFPASSGKSLFVNPQGTNIQQNYTRVGSLQIDAVMNKAAADIDPAQTAADLNAADILVWQEAGMLPLYQQPQIVAVKKALANLGAEGLALPVYQDIGFTK